MMRNIFYYVLVLLFVFCSISCSRTDAVDKIDVMEVQKCGSIICGISCIPTYESEDDFLFHYENLLNDLSYVAELEETLNFVSLGTIADSVYNSLADKYTSDFAENNYTYDVMLQDIEVNSDYVLMLQEFVDYTDDLYYNEYGDCQIGFYDDCDLSRGMFEVVPMMQHNLLRFMINDKRMFIVGDNCIKYFNEGVVVCDTSLLAVRELYNTDNYTNAITLTGVLEYYSFVGSQIPSGIMITIYDIVLGHDRILEKANAIPPSERESVLNFESKGKIGSKSYRVKSEMIAYSYQSYYGLYTYMHTVTVDIKSQKLFLGFIWWNVDSEISYSHQYCSLSNGNEIFNFNDFGTLSPITAKKYELTMGHANLDYLPRYDLFFLHYNGSISSQFENQLVCEMEIKYNKL